MVARRQSTFGRMEIGARGLRNLTSPQGRLTPLIDARGQRFRVAAFLIVIYDYDENWLLLIVQVCAVAGGRGRLLMCLVC